MHDRRYDASVPLCLCSFFLFFLHISLLCRHLAVLLCFFLALLCSLICVVLDLSLLSFLYIPPVVLIYSPCLLLYLDHEKWLSIHIAVIIITTPLALAADFPPPKDVSLRSREGRTALACICALPEILYI